MLRFLTLLLVLLPCTCVLAQQTEITFKDAVTQGPIQNAFYRTSDGQFGATGTDGKLQLSLKKDTLTFSISHLAYRDTTLEIELGQATYYLQPEVMELPAISVSSSKPRRFRKPVQLVKMALRAVPDNYPATTQRQMAIYREILQREDRLVNLNETVLELETTGYGERHRHRKAWSVSWDNHVFRPVRLNGKYRPLGVHHSEGTKQYAGIGDRYRSLQTRVSLGPAPDNYFTWILGGALGAVYLDKVRLGYDYLGAKNLKDYNYELVDTLLVNGTFCYHLKFRPANDKQTKYFGLSKTQPTGVFAGDLYISLDDLSIVRFFAVSTKVIFANSVNGPRRLPPGSVRTEVNYTRNRAGKWRLANVVSSIKSYEDKDLTLTRTLYAVGEKLPALATGKPSIWVRNDNITGSYNFANSYDPGFWKAFSQTDIYGEARKLSGEQAWPSEQADAYFSAPLTFDTISKPRAIPSKKNEYINPKKIKDEFAWLSEPSDSGTTNYLRWENDFYKQFFRWNANAFDRASEQYRRPAQGLPPRQEAEPSVDTIFKKAGVVLGFYQNDMEGDERLLQAVDSFPRGYVLRDYEWSEDGKYYSVLLENRLYDKLLRLYDASGKLTEISGTDDYIRRGDTLFVTTNNAQLRTSGLTRWTPENGWVKQMEADDAAFEFRLVVTPAGELIVISESLTTARIYSHHAGTWLPDEETMPALLGGTGMRGRGCKAEDIEADYLADCRSTKLGTCVLAVSAARFEVWARPSGSSGWKQIRLPESTTAVSFGRSKTDEIKLNTEGPGSYGKSYRLNVDELTLEPLQTKYPPINLSGFRDSTVWVPAKDGTKIPCQLRWRADRRDSLRGTVLKVYAAYGNPFIIGHNSDDIAMMNLGHAVVYVQARGGGTRGPEWQEAGRAANKPVAVADYLAAVRYFHNRHPLGPMPLCGYGQSAGGTILGAAVNEAPELFRAAIFDHAYLDVVNTMSRPELPLTLYEYTEWGNPGDKEIRKTQESYSPYQNIRAQAYPAMLFLAGRYDQSTPYWQIAKFVAAVRKANQGSAPILLHTAPLGSHPGTPFGPGPMRNRENIAFWEVMVSPK